MSENKYCECWMCLNSGPNGECERCGKPPSPERLKPTELAAPSGGESQKATAELRRQLHDFIDHVVRYGEDPTSWPLTQQEQLAFVRTVIFQARKIRNTEAYLSEAVKLAAEDLAIAS